MERPTKENIQGLISYIRNLDIKRLKKVKDEQHDLVLYTFESQQINPNDEVKQILIDDAYLSWMLFMRYDLDRSLGEEVDYEKFKANISSLKKLWYSAKVRKMFEESKKRLLVIMSDEVEKDFPGQLFKPANENSMVMSSVVIAMDYQNIVDTLARKDL